MSDSSLPAIELVDCSKRYKYELALNKINLKISKNEIVGIIGPNGAGKSTLLNVIASIVKPMKPGYVKYTGVDLTSNKSKIRNNVVNFSYYSFLYDDLTGLENLEFWLSLYKSKNPELKEITSEKIINLASAHGMKNWLTRPIHELSTGMRKKIEFLRLILVKPNIILLDEPFSGLDPKNINFVLDNLKNINSTICIASHNLDVMVKICDTIVVLNKGKMINKVDLKSLKIKEGLDTIDLQKFYPNQDKIN